MKGREEAMGRFPQPKLGPVGAILRGISNYFINRFGVQATTDFALKRAGRLPGWYVRALVTHPRAVTYQNRAELTAADRAILFGFNDGLIWWAECLDLNDDEWNFLLSKSIDDNFKKQGGNFYKLRKTLLGRSDLTWERLHAMLVSENLDGEERLRLVQQVTSSTCMAKLWQGDGELLRWTMEQENKKEYLSYFSGRGLVGMAKQMCSGKEWLVLMEELIRLNPDATLSGVVGIRNGTLWDRGCITQARPGSILKMTKLPMVRMDDFVGAPKQMFAPWLVIPSLDRESRIKIIQWLSKLAQMESARGLKGVKPQKIQARTNNLDGISENLERFKDDLDLARLTRRAQV